MSLRRFGMLIGVGAVTTVAISFAGASGCQSNSSTGSSSDGGSGPGGSSSASMTSANGGSGPDSSSTTSAGGSGAGGGMMGMCAGDVTTISDITTGMIGPGLHASLKGVVAMSHKLLVSASKSGSCLWGVYVSAPGLSETGPNTGILALSYGNNATASGDAGKLFCPLLGQDVIGDKIPDDVKPGDILDLIGKTDYYLPACGSPAPTVAQFQFTNVCSATKTGEGPVPTPHVMADADLAKLASGTDKAFHDQWGNVKVRLANVSGSGTTDMYGALTLDQGNGLTVNDSGYYYGYFAKQDICHAGPVYTGNIMWTQIDGFSMLDCNVWGIAPGNKCVDFAPPSEDCMGNTCPGL